MFDLHMHTTYCDGSASAEEMVLSAINMGLDTVGISGHSYTYFDESYCMSLEGTEKYIREVNALKGKYADRIRVLLGIERDLFADISNDPFDYVIGSSHYISAGNEFFDVDSDPETFMDGVRRNFGGDVMAAVSQYYEQVGSIIETCDCDIIGHFDLVTKFNEREELIDTRDTAYIKAWKAAADRLFDAASSRADAGRANRLEDLGLVRAGRSPVFEINTGAMAKGYRTSPYPAPDQIEYIKSRGGILLLSSDSHRTDTLCHGFDSFRGLL